VLENWRAFRAEQHRWFLIADARTEMSVYALTNTIVPQRGQTNGVRTC
jgi:hypothetical protein